MRSFVLVIAADLGPLLPKFQTFTTPRTFGRRSQFFSVGVGGAPEHAQSVAAMKRFSSVGRSSLSLPARPSYAMGLCDRGLERFAVTSNWVHSNDLTTSALSNSPSIAAAAVTPEPTARDSTVQIRASKLT
jgi:hypothetical protein